MNKYLELFKSNFTIVTLICYAFGYTYLGLYYYQFDISIFLYINFSDILFTTINYLILLLITYLTIEFLLYFIGMLMNSAIFKIFISGKIYKRLGKNNRVEKYVKYQSDEYYSNNIKGTTFFLFFVLFFSLLYYYDQKILLLTLFFPFLIIKTYQILPKETGERKAQLNQFIITAFVIILIICFSYWGYNDGNEIKDSKSTKIVQFNEGELHFNTKSDSLNFIGETNTFIFLYNTKKRETLIFNKSIITNLRVKDNSLSKSEKEAQQKLVQKKVDDFFKKYKSKN